MTNIVHIASLNYGLSMINTLLEMNGDLLASHQSLISLLQGVFCKYLIQNSRAEDTQTLSLTLRFIFNLFQTLKTLLKVQLEVFITGSVPGKPAGFLPGADRDDRSLHEREGHAAD